MPGYLSIETREWEPFDGEYAKWRVQTQISFNRQKHVIWRYKKLHDYWTADSPESEPIPAEGSGEIVFMDEASKHYVSKDEFHLRELRYNRHNGEWHVTSTRPGSGTGGALAADVQNGCCLTIRFSYQLHVAEFFWVAGPSPSFHFLNNGYMKSNILRIVENGRYNLRKLLIQEPSPEDVTVRMNKTKSPLDNMISYTTEDLKWLKSIKKRRSDGAHSATKKERLKDEIAREEAKSVYLYGNKNCQFVELGYCYLEDERKRFEGMAQSMDPIKEQMKPWKPFRGMTSLEIDRAAFRPAEGPLRKEGEPLVANSVAVQIPDSEASSFSEKVRSAMFKNSLRSAVCGFRADAMFGVKSLVGLSTTRVLERYCGENRNVPSSALGYISINDYAYSLFEPYISARSLDGLVSVGSVFNHQPVTFLAKSIGANGAMVSYLTDMGCVTDMMRVLLWRRCKVFCVNDARYVLDLEKEMNDMYALERGGDIFRFGYDAYMKNNDHTVVTPESQRHVATDKRDLFMYWSKGTASVDAARLQSAFIPPQARYLDLKLMKAVERAPDSALLTDACVADPAASARSHTTVRIVRQQRFYFDKVGYNVEVTTRVEPVLLICLCS